MELAQLTLVTSKLVTPAGVAIATLRQDLPFQARAPLRPPTVTHRGPVLPVAQEMLATVAVLMIADLCGCQDLPFQWSITRTDLRPVPVAMQLVLDVQLIWVRSLVAAGAGTDRHDEPFQATETGAPGPTARQYFGPEHQTEFSTLRFLLPAGLAGVAEAGALTVSGASVAVATATTVATAPDLQLRTPDHRLLIAR